MNYNDKARAAIDPIHKIGKVTKNYGSEGEVVLKLGGAITARELIERVKEEPLWIEIDSIATPFFVLSAKNQGVGAAVVKFQFIDSEQRSTIVMGREVFLSSVEREREKASDWGELEGYNFEDVTSGVSGKVIEVIDNSLNPLLLVSIGEEEVYVPLAEDLIVGFDSNHRVISMELVEGFFENIN